MNQNNSREEIINKRVERYGMAYEGILPKESIDRSKEHWRNELLDFADEITQTFHQELQQAREEIVNELDGLMETLADIEHVRWAKWQNYLHSHLTWNNEIQAWVLQHEWKDRWQMQINKPYSMLSEKEKESDREQVRPYLELIKRKVRYQSELDQPTELFNTIKKKWDKQAEDSINGYN